MLVSILFSMDDKEFIEIVDDLASALGLAVDSKIFIPLLLKLIAAEASKTSVKALTNVMVVLVSKQKLTIQMLAATPNESVTESLTHVLGVLKSLEPLLL